MATQDDQVTAWFQRRHGRPPTSKRELMLSELTESRKINPRLRKKQELILAFAERSGGQVLEYAKLRFAHYWDADLPTTHADVCSRLGITEAEGLDLMVQIMENIWPEYRSSPEFAEQPNPSDLRRIDFSK